MIQINPSNLKTWSNTEKKQQPMWISIAWMPDIPDPQNPSLLYLVTLSYHYVFLAYCGLQAMPLHQIQPAKNVGGF